MRPLPWRKNGHCLSYRICSGLCLVSYLIAVLGLPIPVYARKDHSQAFPCQDDPCGCQTAEQCWRHCCCYTPAQHWAWARAHGVVPPSYATRPDPSGDPPACCAHHTQANKHAASRACCSTKAKPHGSVRWLTGWASQRCAGGHVAWTIAGAVLPLARLGRWSPFLIPVDWLLERAALAGRLAFFPPEPPPRPVAA